MGSTGGMSGVGRSGGLTTTTGGGGGPPALSASTPGGGASGGKDGPNSIRGLFSVGTIENLNLKYNFLAFTSFINQKSS